MIIKRYIVKIDGVKREPRETVCLDMQTEEEQKRLLREIYAQGISRLGYVRSEAEGRLT